MAYGYSMKIEGDKFAKASGRSLGISPKMSIEICTYLRGKKAEAAVKMLEEVMVKKRAVPLRRFNRDVGHKPNIGPGRYPVKAATEIRKILKSTIANAQSKGLNASDLVIKHMCAHKGAESIHHGRQRGRMNKRTHIEIILTEASKPKQKKKPSKSADKK